MAAAAWSSLLAPGCALLSEGPRRAGGEGALRGWSSGDGTASPPFLRTSRICFTNCSLCIADRKYSVYSVSTAASLLPPPATPVPVVPSSPSPSPPSFARSRMARESPTLATNMVRPCSSAPTAVVPLTSGSTPAERVRCEPNSLCMSKKHFAYAVPGSDANSARDVSAPTRWRRQKRLACSPNGPCPSNTANTATSLRPSTALATR
mmetsp:Transcript_16163/g.56428  ORF Transcript_16163/g.56428 Transcript_16163/m.56428 type:complete len:207 (-) Transcript_16163:450-1070(-)